MPANTSSGAPTKVYSVPTVVKWTNIDLDDPDAPLPSPRAFHCMCRVKNFMFILGGEGGEYGPDADILSDVWRFDMQRLVWKELHTSGEIPRLSRAAAVCVETAGFTPEALSSSPSSSAVTMTSSTASTIVVCGGFDGMFQTSDVHCLDLRTSAWTRFDTVGDVPVGGLAHHAAVLLPEGRILVVATCAGSSNSEFFELMLHHSENRAVYRRVAGIELRVELQEQRLKAAAVARFAAALVNKNKKKKKPDDESANYEDGDAPLLEPRFGKFRRRFGHTATVVQVSRQERSLYVVGGNISAHNEQHNLHVDLGMWSVEMTVLHKVEQALLSALDERRVTSLGRRMKAADIYRAEVLPLKVVVKMLADTQKVFLTMADFEVFCRHYDPVTQLLARSGRSARQKRDSTAHNTNDESEELGDEKDPYLTGQGALDPIDLEQRSSPPPSSSSTSRSQGPNVRYAEFVKLLLRLLVERGDRPDFGVTVDESMSCGQSWCPGLWECVRHWKVPKGRRFHTTTPIDPSARFLLMFGGDNFHSKKDTCSGECAIFDTQKRRWYLVPIKRPVTRRFGHSALWWGDYSQYQGGGLLVFGGVGTSRIFSNDLKILGVPQFHADPPRPDPEDGQLLYKEDFVKKYGGTAEWRYQDPVKVALRAAEQAADERRALQKAALEQRLQEAKAAEQARQDRLRNLQLILAEEAQLQLKLESGAAEAALTDKRNRLAKHRAAKKSRRAQRRAHRRSLSRGGAAALAQLAAAQAAAEAAGDNGSDGSLTDDGETEDGFGKLFAGIKKLATQATDAIRTQTQALAEKIKDGVRLGTPAGSEDVPTPDEASKGLDQSNIERSGNAGNDNNAIVSYSSSKLKDTEANATTETATLDNRDERAQRKHVDEQADDSATDLTKGVGAPADPQAARPESDINLARDARPPNQRVATESKGLLPENGQDASSVHADSSSNGQWEQHPLPSQLRAEGVAVKKRHPKESMDAAPKLNDSTPVHVHVGHLPDSLSDDEKDVDSLLDESQSRMKESQTQQEGKASDGKESAPESIGNEISAQSHPIDAETKSHETQRVPTGCDVEISSSSAASSVPSSTATSATKDTLTDPVVASQLLAAEPRNDAHTVSPTTDATVNEQLLRVPTKSATNAANGIASEAKPHVVLANQASTSDIVLANENIGGTHAATDSDHWEQHYDDEGYVYYWNRLTQQSQWDSPWANAISKIKMISRLGGKFEGPTPAASGSASARIGATPPVTPRPEGTPRKEDNASDRNSPNADVDLWEEHFDDEGYAYYWNKTTGESSWNKPVAAVKARLAAMKAFGGGLENFRKTEPGDSTHS